MAGRMETTPSRLLIGSSTSFTLPPLSLPHLRASICVQTPIPDEWLTLSSGVHHYMWVSSEETEAETPGYQ